MCAKSNTYPVLFAVMALVFLTAGIVSAATVTPSITYQGKLTNAAGSPLTGTYSVTFKVYDASTGGTVLSTDTHSVTAANGLFTTSIAVSNPALVDGRALWLGIKVGTDPEMTPRQEIRPVPYALSLRPGAVIDGANFVTDRAGTAAAPVPGLNVSTKYTWNPGILVNTTGVDSCGVWIETHGMYSPALYAKSEQEPGIISDSSNGAGVKGTSTFMDGVTGGSRDLYGVSGYSTNSYGIFGKGKRGGYFSTNAAGTASSKNPGITVATSYANNPGIQINTISADSPGVNITTLGGFSTGMLASTSGSYSHGMDAYTTGNNGLGVFVSTSGPNSHGVYAKTTNANSAGVVGYTEGTDSTGVYAYAIGPRSIAVRGQSDQDIGVYGKGNPGGYFTTSSAGTSFSSLNSGINVTTDYWYNPGIMVKTIGYGSTAVNASTSEQWSRGLDVRTTGDYSTGMLASTQGYGSLGVDSSTSGDWSTGVNAHTLGQFSTGVYASTEGFDSLGVDVHTTGEWSKGVMVSTSGKFSPAVAAYSVQDNGIWAQTDKTDNKYGVQTPDIIRALGYETGASDVAEFIPATGDGLPGTVMVIGADGILRPSAAAYDTSVAGIVSTAPGVSLGAKEGGNTGDQIIAIAGRVPCKVDASNGPIHPRDLLTTSDNPGYAMKAVPVNIGGVEIYRPGTTLGKALGTLESGTGTIEVLVTLQ